MNELLHFATRIFSFNPEKKDENNSGNNHPSAGAQESERERVYGKEQEHNPYIHAPRLFELL